MGHTKKSDCCVYTTEFVVPESADTVHSQNPRDTKKSHHSRYTTEESGSVGNTSESDRMIHTKESHHCRLIAVESESDTLQRRTQWDTPTL